MLPGGGGTPCKPKSAARLREELKQQRKLEKQTARLQQLEAARNTSGVSWGYDDTEPLTIDEAAQHYEEWHGEYEFKDELIPPHKSMKLLYMKEEQSSDLLKLLSRHLEVDITYYEEIFNNKQRESYFGLPIDSKKLFDNFLNTKHRYRK